MEYEPRYLKNLDFRPNPLFIEYQTIKGVKWVRLSDYEDMQRRKENDARLDMEKAIDRAYEINR